MLGYMKSPDRPRSTACSREDVAVRCGGWVLGQRDERNPSSTRPGSALATSRIVGARSMFPVSCGGVTSDGTPGPRTTNGTPRALLVEGGLPRQTVLAEQVAVVGGEHDQRVVELAHSLELADYPLDGVIDHEETRQPASSERMS